MKNANELIIVIHIISIFNLKKKKTDADVLIVFQPRHRNFPLTLSSNRCEIHTEIQVLYYYILTLTESFYFLILDTKGSEGGGLNWIISIK